MTSPVIDLHPERKGGLLPPDLLRPRLLLRSTGAVRSAPAHPLASEMFTGVTLAMDLNDQFGTCVPTAMDNLRRMVTRLLTGVERQATIDDIIAWYRTQNPGFNPNVPGGVEDNGMVIQYFLEYCVKAGIILGFAEVDVHDDEMLKAVNYLAMGPLNGFTLTRAQVTTQYDEGRWYVDPASPRAGGHCTATGAYAAADPSEEDCATWQKRVQMSATFLDSQRFEAWAVIFPEHATHAGFREHFDLAAMAAAIEQITGRPAPFTVEPVPPAPPTPQPPDNSGRWVQLDPDVAPHVRHAAAAKGLTDEQWVNRHFRRYF